MADDEKQTKAKIKTTEEQAATDKLAAAEENRKTEAQANKLILEGIETKKTELAETETRLDKKSKDLEALVKEAEKAGHAIAGSTTTITEETQKQKDAMKLIAGTGLEHYIAGQNNKTQA